MTKHMYEKSLCLYMCVNIGSDGCTSINPWPDDEKSIFLYNKYLLFNLMSFFVNVLNTMVLY